MNLKGQNAPLRHTQTIIGGGPTIGCGFGPLILSIRQGGTDSFRAISRQMRDLDSAAIASFELSQDRRRSIDEKKTLRTAPNGRPPGVNAHDLIEK